MNEICLCFKKDIKPPAEKYRHHLYSIILSEISLKKQKNFLQHLTLWYTGIATGILSFKSKLVEDLCLGVNSKRLRALLPLELHRIAIKKIQIIRAAKNLNDIANFPGLKLEKLKGSRKDEYSIRINDQYRICFSWDGRDAVNLNIEDYH